MIKTLLLGHGVRYGHLSPIASPEWKRVQALFTGNCFQSLSFMLRWAWLYLVHISQPHTPALTPSPPGVPRTTSQIQEPGIGRTWNSASGHSPIHSGNPVPGRLHWTVFFFKVVPWFFCEILNSALNELLLLPYASVQSKAIRGARWHKSLLDTMKIVDGYLLMFFKNCCLVKFGRG